MKYTNLIAVTVAAVVAFAAARSQAVETGQPAPDFALKDINGKDQKISDYKGKFVVLEWVNHGCPFVKKHYNSGNMQKLQKEYTAKDVVWLSICSSAPGKQGNYTPEEWLKLNEEKKSAATAVLLDGDGTVGKLYDAKTTPHMFVVNPDGTLIYQGAIDNKPSTEESDIRGANNYVASALDEAMAGKPVTKGTTKSYGCGVKYP